MESSGDDDQPNYWPVFVDAISNVALVLLLTMMIMVLMSSQVTKKTSQQAQESTQAQSKHEVDQQVRDLQARLDAAQAEVKKIRDEEVKASALAVPTEGQEKTPQRLDVESADQIQMKQGAVGVEESADRIVLHFPPSITQMDEQSADNLGHVLDGRLKKTLSAHKIILRSIMGHESYTAARHRAYYRAITARNVLINKVHEQPSNIVMQMVEPTKQEEGRVEIIIQQ